MKKAYYRPMVEKVAFSYQEQIVASQIIAGQYVVYCEINLCDHKETNCRLVTPGNGQDTLRYSLF